MQRHDVYHLTHAPVHLSVLIVVRFQFRDIIVITPSLYAASERVLHYQRRSFSDNFIVYLNPTVICVRHLF